MTDDANQILRDAADYIAEHGWTQGAMYDKAHPRLNPEAPPACAMGAIEMSVGEEADTLAHQREAQDRLTQYLRDNGLIPRDNTAGPSGNYVEEPVDGPGGVATQVLLKHPIAFWNDMRTTTAEDVILGLKGAAE